MRGQADYGAMAAKDSSASVSDMGEIASRLGSIVTFDKRGSVIGFDCFEVSILKWAKGLAPLGETALLNSENVKSGSQAVKMVTAANANSSVGISKTIPALASKSIGLEVSFSWLVTGCYLNLNISYYSGTKLYYVAVWVNKSTELIEIYDSTGAWKSIGSGVIAEYTYFYFNTIKLVADFATGYYKRLLYNNAEYDISTEAIYSVVSSSTSLIGIGINLINFTADAGGVWVDDIIWTQGEP